ncbi:MAG: glutaredoxin family protein [Gammaproteobacteria bacterium]|nr:glutaredoxin family protein [Gammaproteobacteria bacterium]
MAGSRLLLLYGTVGCTLCETAREIALAEAARAGFAIEDVDIADDESLLERYGALIPVLRRSDRSSELRWPFDHHALRMLLQDD